MAKQLKEFLKLFDKGVIRELRGIPKDIAVLAADEFDQNFKRQAFFDEVWDQSKRVGNGGKGSTLQLTGDLRKSIDYEVNGNEIKFTSDREDAQAHNEGAKTRPHEIRAKRGRSLKFAGNEGKNVYRKKVNHPGSVIPKRQFIGNHPYLDDEVEKYLDKKMDQIFDR
jgi:phage gpG-like protein